MTKQIKKIKVIELASLMLKDEIFSNTEVVDIKSELNGYNYSKDDMMKLLLAKIKGTCYNSECLVDKAKLI